jgi:hypothetical protein
MSSANNENNFLSLTPSLSPVGKIYNEFLATNEKTSFHSEK